MEFIELPQSVDECREYMSGRMSCDLEIWDYMQLFLHPPSEADVSELCF